MATAKQKLEDATQAAKEATAEAEGEKELHTPNDEGFVKQAETAGKAVGADIAPFILGPVTGELVKEKIDATDKPAADPKKKAKSKASGQMSEADALKELTQYLTTNQVFQGEEAMAQEGGQLANENAGITSTVDQFITGTNSGSAAVNAAQDAYAKAYSAGEGLNSAAYQNMGQANAEYVQSSPLQPIINLLTQGLGSGQYKELPASLVQSLPQSVREALAAAGVTTATSQGEGNPISTKANPNTATGTALLNGAEGLGALNIANPAAGVAAPQLNPASTG